MKSKSIVVTVAMLCLYCTAQATVWYVHPDSTMNCIQDCLDSCSLGDTVLVGAGIYYENISWPSTNGILLTSEYGPDTSIIEGDSSGTVMSIFGTVDTTTIITGFTIRGGYAAGGDAGGIYCYNASPSIDNNIITQNVADYEGGGIRCQNSSPIIVNNVISHNYSLGGDNGGGGICVSHVSSPRIINNSIVDNNTSGNGAGITCYASSGTNIVITDNTISNNTADETGGGIFCNLASPIMTNNMISGNTAQWGGGIGCYGGSPTIVNDSVINNFAYSTGGGITCVYSCSPTIHSSVFNGNQAYAGGGYGGSGIRISVNSIGTITDCEISNSIGTGITCNQSSPTIEHCLISNNTTEGIRCQDNSNSEISNCYISGNQDDGIYCDNSSPTIYWNDIMPDNSPYGVHNGTSSITIDADSNWWGDPTGPYHPTTNPSATGAAVSDYVNYTPWLTSPGVMDNVISKPQILSLQVSPNPCRYAANIRWQIAGDAYDAVDHGVTLKIYDASGKLVNDFRNLPIIAHQSCVKWAGHDDQNRILPSGVYFVQITTGNQTLSKKILLIR